MTRATKENFLAYLYLYWLLSVDQRSRTNWQRAVGGEAIPRLLSNLLQEAGTIKTVESFVDPADTYCEEKGVLCLSVATIRRLVEKGDDNIELYDGHPFYNTTTRFACKQ